FYSVIPCWYPFIPCSISIHASPNLCRLLSFPTRRSSDLAETGGGSIKVDDIGGSVSAETGGDYIDVGTVGGDVNLQTGGGRISIDRKSTRLNSSHQIISYAVFCLKKKKKKQHIYTIISMI